MSHFPHPRDGEPPVPLFVAPFRQEVNSMKMDKKNGFLMNRREFLTVTSAAGLLACQSSTPKKPVLDAGPDADVPDADIPDADIPDAEPDADVPLERPDTTVRKTIRGRLAEAPLFEDLRPLYGLTKEMPGEPWITRDEWNVVGASSGTVTAMASMAYFAQLTDVHMLDEESPARAIHSPIAAASAWRPHDAYSTHMLDAAMRTINEFAAVHPHDFVLFTGDVTDNNLWIELRWFLDVVEGNTIDPDTGIDDSPMAGDPLDPHEPYDAAGLDPRISWYLCIGNHDAWVLGSLGVSVVADPTGSSSTAVVSSPVTPTCFTAPPCPNEYCYSEVPDRCYVPMSASYYSGSYIPPDARRRYVDLDEFKSMVMQSTRQGPLGHGFTMENLNSRTNYYTVDEPVPGIPLSLIALDTTTACTVQNKATGAMDNAQFNWLADRLAFYSGQNRAIIVMSHHPAESIPDRQTELVNLLRQYPHVVLHVVGHGHINRVYPRPPGAGQQAWHGYWEVQTPSTLEWPQQMRFFEIADHGDGTGSVIVTVVNLAIDPETCAEAGRYYSLVDVQEGRADAGLEGNINARNVILRFAWPPELLPVLASMPRRPVESLHFAS